MSNVRYFTLNDKTHPAFGSALREAKAAGVTVMAFDCVVVPDELTIDKRAEVRL